MKKYRLKQWYPDTPSYMMAGFIIDYYYEEEKAIYTYPNGTKLVFSLPTHHLECRNFWELVEKPLFVTEDEEQLFNWCQIVYLIHPQTFIRQKGDLSSFSANALDNNKVFLHEANADEYIWKNKSI